MRIVYLIAGAGSMYCGSCLQGNTLAAALCAAGQECTLMPLYTPIRTDEESISIDRVMFGGINVYLQQRWAVFRHTPWFFDRLFDWSSLLRLVGRRSQNVRPEHLGALTVSMLQGEEGRQRKEVEKLVRWLDREVHPHVVHLNTVLLIGLARQIARQLGVPVVCNLSGEDAFLERLPEPYRSRAMEVLRERAVEATALVAMNRYYADFMAALLRVPKARIHVVPPGLNLAGHGTHSERQSPICIGYLARVCPEKGLKALAAALRRLANDPSVPPVCVRAAGYLDPADRPYLLEIQREMELYRVADRFQYVGELDRRQKIAFLQACDVFTLPTTHPESKGISVFEAWANAVPAVLPAHGAFPEMVADTGGGVLYSPGDPAALASALKQMILDPGLAAVCGCRAQQAVRERYNMERTAQHMIEVYQQIVTV
jgi:glycosyltransferase involved in cell wall biosynthesis